MICPDKRLVPTLRFPEFTDLWEERSLSSMSDVTSSKRVYLSDYVSSGIPFFRGKEITELKQGKTPTSILYIQESKYIKIKNQFGAPANGDILITSVGTLGNTYRVNLSYDFYFKDGNLIWLKNIKADSQFLEMAIDCNKMALLRNVIGSTQKALTIEGVKKLTLSIPTLKEQQKIASFLSSVDGWINNLKEQKELLQQYKKGIMQKIFTQSIRFKDGNGSEFPEWSEKLLENVLTFTVDNRGKTPPIENNGIPLIEVNAIGNKNVQFENITKFVDNDIYKTWFRQHLKKGDILFSTVGDTAMCTLYNGSEVAVIAQNIVGLRFENEDPDFMYYLLTEKRNNYKFKRIQMVAVQPSVKVSQMIKIKFIIPNLEEQQKISAFLSSIDAIIDEKDAQARQSEIWKKSLIYGLFI